MKISITILSCFVASSLIAASYTNSDATQSLSDIFGTNVTTSADKLSLKDGIDINSNSDITLGELEISYPQGGAAWTQSAGTLTLGALVVGNLTGAETKGQLTIDSGAKVLFNGENTATTNSFIRVAGQGNSTGQIDISGELEMTVAKDFSIGQGSGSKGIVNVKEGGKLTLTNANNLTVGVGNGSNTELNVYGEMTMSNGNVYLGRAQNAISLWNIDGGSFVANKTSGDLGFIIADGNNPNATLRVQNGGVFQQTSGTKNVQFTVGRHGTGNIEVLSGGAIYIGGNYVFGDRSDSIANLKVDGGKIGGTGAGTSYTGDISMATASGAQASAVVSGGGEVRTRGFYMSQGGNNSSSSLTLKDQGTYFQVSLANDTNYWCKIGVDANDTNSALLEIHTGAQFKNNQNTVFLYESGKVKFVLDSDNADYAYENNKAMFVTPKMAITAAEGSAPFEIDGSKLKANSKYIEGEEVTFILMSVQNLTFNDTEFDFMDFSDEMKESLFVISHNENLDNWFDFGYDELSHDGENFVLTLTYIPESSTYAMVFAGLALAFAIYRRRR